MSISSGFCFYRTRLTVKHLSSPHASKPTTLPK
uniref:Uncharacterized protein n=1 Tax=Myoviridae sp. ctqfO1 TaxID=2827710 RepID=A0A8S5T3Y6_9CAUD|nr:MAG TPA: hypothetical protein [Myoviridae sp. ctqfO1]